MVYTGRYIKKNEEMFLPKKKEAKTKPKIKMLTVSYKLMGGKGKSRCELMDLGNGPTRQPRLSTESTFKSSNVYTGEGNGTPLQYSCLENPMDGGASWAAVHELAKSRTRLSDFTFTFHFHALEKEMATHSSTLAWRIPWTQEPGRLQSMGLLRVGHD